MLLGQAISRFYCLRHARQIFVEGSLVHKGKNLPPGSLTRRKSVGSAISMAWTKCLACRHLPHIERREKTGQNDWLTSRSQGTHGLERAGCGSSNTMPIALSHALAIACRALLVTSHRSRNWTIGMVNTLLPSPETSARLLPACLKTGEIEESCASKKDAPLTFGKPRILREFRSRTLALREPN